MLLAAENDTWWLVNGDSVALTLTFDQVLSCKLIGSAASQVEMDLLRRKRYIGLSVLRLNFGTLVFGLFPKGCVNSSYKKRKKKKTAKRLVISY